MNFFEAKINTSQPLRERERERERENRDRDHSEFFLAKYQIKVFNYWSRIATNWYRANLETENGSHCCENTAN